MENSVGPKRVKKCFCISADVDTSVDHDTSQENLDESSQEGSQGSQNSSEEQDVVTNVSIDPDSHS